LGVDFPKNLLVNGVFDKYETYFGSIDNGQLETEIEFCKDAIKGDLVSILKINKHKQTKINKQT